MAAETGPIPGMDSRSLALTADASSWAMTLSIRHSRSRIRTIYAHQAGLILILFASALLTQYLLGRPAPFCAPMCNSR